MCYKLLENPGFVREKTARDKVFGLMGSLMKRFNMALGERSTPHHSETSNKMKQCVKSLLKISLMCPILRFFTSAPQNNTCTWHLIFV